MESFIDILTSTSSSAKQRKHFLANYQYYSLWGFCNNNKNHDKFLIINPQSPRRKGYGNCLLMQKIISTVSSQFSSFKRVFSPN